VARAKKARVVDERQYRSSSHREKVVEHVFLGELLRHLWVAKIPGVQVLKPEVDASGYDLVLSLGKVIRHVQLKTMMKGGKARQQPVHDSLALQPSGCVVWIVLKEDLGFDHFLWYGESPGRSLTGLLKCKFAKQARANAKGQKALKKNTRKVPKSAFKPVPDMAGLVEKLFGRV
jgi:hypothetical protein